MDYSKFLSIVVEAGAFISAFAAIAAGLMMAKVTKKFGTGILASGFKTISLGVLFIAVAIILDAINSYIQFSSNLLITAILLVKEILFVTGTYIIVIGSKKTGDKLESLIK